MKSRNRRSSFYELPEVPSLNIFIDGASRGNPGEGAIAVVVCDASGRELQRIGKRLGPETTNNYAEYSALIEALRFVGRRKEEGAAPRGITIYSDSELLVKQLNGLYRVRSPHLLPLFLEARAFLEEIGGVRVEHVGREKNKIADWIVNRVLDGKPYRPVDRSREGTPSRGKSGLLKGMALGNTQGERSHGKCHRNETASGEFVVPPG